MELNKEELKKELKQVIVKTCRKKNDPATIPDDVPLIGKDTFLELDSLDVLELSAVLLKNYGLRMMDSKDAFRMMKSIDVLADTILSLKKS